MDLVFFFLQAEGGIRVGCLGLESKRVLFRANPAEGERRGGGGGGGARWKVMETKSRKEKAGVVKVHCVKVYGEK